MILGRDGIAGLVCLAISIWLLVLTRGLPPAVMVPIGPAAYPRIVLGIMALLSAIMIVNDVLASRAAAAAAPVTPAAPSARPNYPLVLATFVAFGIYVLLLPYLGFRITTFLFVAALQVILDRPRSWPRWLLVVAVAFATTLVCHFVFEDYLSVLLPRGDWSGV
ncbi:MAG: tripartite tricarboxylate transporter TctB family protein [Variibacter sp.]